MLESSEKRLIVLLSMGYRIFEISEILRIHETTARRKLTKIRKKLKTRTNFLAVSMAVGRGHIPHVYMLEPVDLDAVLKQLQDGNGFETLLEQDIARHPALHRLKTLYRRS